MRKILVSAVLISAMLLNLHSQAGTQLIKVIVAPDHQDWTYKVNEKAKFTVLVFKYGNLLENVTVDYEAGPDMLPDIKKEGVVLKNGKLELSGTMKQPGFYRVRVWAVADGKRYEGLATAAFEPEKIQPTVKDPSGFDSFWNDEIAKARKINLDPRLTLVPERCTSDADVYHISFQNEAPGSRIYGMLAMPKKPGKYPAILRVPGAGIRPYSGDTRTAGQGFIVLDIGIHGIPVNLEQQLYTDLGGAALSEYFNIRMNDRNRHYFKRVYLGCVRAVDFIFSLPEFNGTDIAVTGGSQGGALTIVTAGLDKRIRFAAGLYPALCDHTGYLNKRAGGWPHYFRNTEPKPGEVETLAYFDVVNFARRVSAPGYYTWGFNDIVCPPTSMYSAYNVMTAPKELHLYQETGHWTFPEQTEALNNWLMKKLKGE
ncbi:MAG TPA: acetylxylan esterase [Bacteroidales bacterium]|jgi:cephalosporin-C deacetylase-like acetyl esterase|nr:acetylxylan esterase [Bacteroidales bacterium]HOS72813.1 acetylxylan esterase [Bacteroidales bacterium]HQH24132.1 acetylxylan esterase [Bacteroidales bacterium]HQJ82755.1 acetylxylan esterase [Bacteroidales bacterium]